MKACGHFPHLNGLSPECRRRWSVRWPWVVKVFSHPGMVHEKGFSPEWIRMWVLRLPFSVKVFWQLGSGHWNGFSPVYRHHFVNFPYMGAQVNLQAPRSWIAFAAFVANVRLVPWMNQLVRLKVTFGDELLATGLIPADKRPFPSLQRL